MEPAGERFLDFGRRLAALPHVQQNIFLGRFVYQLHDPVPFHPLDLA